MNSLTIESLNCRGLRDLSKQIDVLGDFKSRKINIIHLQETHLIPAKKLWNCKFLISGEKNNPWEW